METEKKDKTTKNGRKNNGSKVALKDLQARKQDAEKVQGGTITYGPED